MKAICFMQEVKEGDLTIREQMLVCRRALRKLRWPCVLELFAQAGTEEQPLSLRPGMVELLHAAANGEADVLVVVDAAHLYCGRPELEGLLASLLHYGIHTFGAKDGNWIEPADVAGWSSPDMMRRSGMVEDKEKHLFFPRVWLYARTSTKDHDAVDWQLSELADWAAQEGYRGVGRSYDFASPKVIWCSGLSAMLHVVRRGEVDAVAVTWISSLGRTRKKLIKILATLQKHNVALITTEENLRYQLYLYGLDTVLVKHTMRKADERSCPTA